MKRILSFSLIIFLTGSPLFCITIKPTLIWEYLYQGFTDYSDIAYTCTVNSSDNLYIVGNFNAPEIYRYGLYAIKCNGGTGDTIWSTTFKGNGSQLSCAYDANGYFYVAHIFNDDYGITEINAQDGRISRTISYGGPHNRIDLPLHCVLNNNKIYVTGQEDCADFQTISIDLPTGALDWATILDTTSILFSGARSCCIDDSGNLYVAGDFCSFSGNNRNSFIIKYKALTGETLWTRDYSIDPIKDDVIYDCMADGINNLYLVGTLSNEYMVFKINAISSDVTWIKTFNGPTNGSAYGLAGALDGKGGLYITGSEGWGKNIYTIKLDANTGDTIWSKIYCDSLQSDGFGYSCITDRNGDVFVVGFNKLDGDNDYLAIKYRGTNGDILWKRRYANNLGAYDCGWACCTGKDGEILVVGETQKNIHSDGLALKIDPSTGQQSWFATYDGKYQDDDWFYDCAIDLTGNYIIEGSTKNFYSGFDPFTIMLDRYTSDTLWVFAPDNYPFSSSTSDYGRSCGIDDSGFIYTASTVFNYISNNDDILALKLDPNSRDTIWTSFYNNTSYRTEYAAASCTDELGDYYVSGYSEDDYGHNDMLFLKFDGKTGKLCWGKNYNSSIYNWSARSFGCTSDRKGGVYISGYVWTYNNGADICVLKYDYDGNLAWVKTYNSQYNNDDVGYGCTTDGQGFLYVSGYSSNDSNKDIILLKFKTENGDTVWTVRYNGRVDSDDWGADCVLDDSGNIYLTGLSYNTTDCDAILLKYSPGLFIEDTTCVPRKLEIKSIYPCPASNYINVSYTLPSANDVEICIFNILGQRVKSMYKGRQHPNTYVLTCNLENEQGKSLANGLYFCVLTIGEKNIIKKFTVIK